MVSQIRFRLTGLLMIGFSLLTISCFEGLRQTFQYPDILRMGTGYVLTEYHQLATTVQPFWYGMVVGSLCLMIAALLLHDCLRALSVNHLLLLTGLGVLAGLFNTLGFMRWVFMVPALATTYTDPASTEATKQAVLVVFEAFHLYLGFSIGEHLGFIFLAFWGLCLSLTLLPVAGFPRWLSWLGVVTAVGTFLGILEGAGWEPAAVIVAISSSVQIIWILLVGVFLFRLRPQQAVGDERASSPKTNRLPSVA